MIFSLSQYLNSRRIQNSFILYFDYLYSCILKKPILRAKPISASIEPANFCNLRCPECPTGKKEFEKENKKLTFDLFKKILNPLLPELTYLNLYFQGEPFLNEEIFSMIQYAHSKKIYTSISTNGHFLDSDNIKKILSSNLDHLIVSVDGSNQKSYELYRIGGNFDTVINGIKELVQKKKEAKSKTPFIELQFLVLHTNEDEIEEMKKLAKKLSVDKLQLKSAQVYDYENGNNLIPTKSKYSRYKKLPNGKFIIKKKLRHRCWRQWSSVVITAQGELLPCCFDKKEKYSFGNIFEDYFEDLWLGGKAMNFRQEVLLNRKDITICTNCTE